MHVCGQVSEAGELRGGAVKSLNRQVAIVVSKFKKPLSVTRTDIPPFRAKTSKGAEF